MVEHPMDNRDRFIADNLGLVHACAHRFTGRGLEYDDLYSAGCVGLVKAVDGFDRSRGLMFSTYAVPVILGEMRRLFRDGGAVKIGRTLKDKALKVARTRTILQGELYRDPTVDELARRLGLSIEEVAEACAAAQTPLSLTGSDDEDGAQFDIPTPGVDDQIGDTLALREVVSALPEKDQSLIELRYYRSKTQMQTAEALGMTQVQVSRREKAILSELRRRLSG